MHKRSTFGRGDHRSFEALRQHRHDGIGKTGCRARRRRRARCRDARVETSAIATSRRQRHLRDSQYTASSKSRASPSIVMLERAQVGQPGVSRSGTPSGRSTSSAVTSSAMRGTPWAPSTTSTRSRVRGVTEDLDLGGQGVRVGIADDLGLDPGRSSACACPRARSGSRRTADSPASSRPRLGAGEAPGDDAVNASITSATTPWACRRGDSPAGPDEQVGVRWRYGLPLMYVDVVAAVVTDDRGEAVTVSLDPAADEIDFSEGEARVDRDELPVPAWRAGGGAGFRDLARRNAGARAASISSGWPAFRVLRG